MKKIQKIVFGILCILLIFAPCSNMVFAKSDTTSESNVFLDKSKSSAYNSTDFSTDYYIYDDISEIMAGGTTSSKNFGYISVHYTRKVKYGGHFTCGFCRKEYHGCDMMIPCFDDPPEEDDRIVHVELANGHTGHCGRNLWNKLVREGYYKPYDPNAKPLINCKFYCPVAEGVVAP